MRNKTIIGWVVKFSYNKFEFAKYFEATEFAKTLMEHCTDEDAREATLIPVYAENPVEGLPEEDPEEIVEVNA